MTGSWLEMALSCNALLRLDIPTPGEDVKAVNNPTIEDSIWEAGDYTLSLPLGTDKSMICVKNRRRLPESGPCGARVRRAERGHKQVRKRVPAHGCGAARAGPAARGRCACFTDATRADGACWALLP
ncbi:hypothetical protein Busp01_20680 [Trinickia caryophylli]|nr:hypothetical protein Busp01_20680 [Trinickia caryophylli]